MDGRGLISCHGSTCSAESISARMDSAKRVSVTCGGKSRAWNDFRCLLGFTWRGIDYQTCGVDSHDRPATKSKSSSTVHPRRINETSWLASFPPSSAVVLDGGRSGGSTRGS